MIVEPRFSIRPKFCHSREGGNDGSDGKSGLKYRHYKGGVYEVIGEAQLESDPAVMMIVYMAEDGQTWTRPRAEFFEFVKHEGKNLQRFSPLN